MTAAFASALEGAEATPAAEASPASTPAQETTPADTSAPAATTQAVETPVSESVSTDDPPKGEPPKWRWQDILANARETTQKETEARVRQEIEQQYGEFKGLTPEERTGLTILNRAIRGDPQAMAHVAQVNPAFAQQLGYQPQPDPEPQPDAAIQLADGSQVPVFTPEGMKKREAWLQKQLESSLTEKFKPLAQTAEQLRQQQDMAAAQQQTQQWAQRVLNPIKKLPYFEEFKPGIQKALAELPKDFSGNLEDVVVAAYVAQHTAKLKELTTQGEAKALANIQQRTVAGTPNPNAANATTPKKFQPSAEGFQEALAHFGGA